MRTIDFSPLYRSVVGFDRMASLLETAAADSGAGYPPYNIERTDEERLPHRRGGRGLPS
jgi:molecular chaperone IbpA